MDNERGAGSASRSSLSARLALMATLEWERACWRDHYQAVVGIDEAGRGALAGPIVAGAVVLPCSTRLTARYREINDSKLLSAQTRDRLAQFIRSVALSWATGWVSAAEIDEIGITRANRLCMERALEQLTCAPDFALIDAITCEIPIPQVGLIDGDALSLSIAAASILAKTDRDQYMRSRHQEDQRYQFDHHVGYGTELHLAALRKHGPSQLHRMSFHGVLAD